MMVMIAINMTIIKMMMKKKKAWPFMPISDQSERFRARRPETSQRPSAFFIGRRSRMRRMARMIMLMMMLMIMREEDDCNDADDDGERKADDEE